MGRAAVIAYARYVQLAAEDASYTMGNIYGAGGGMGQP